MDHTMTLSHKLFCRVQMVRACMRELECDALLAVNGLDSLQCDACARLISWLILGSGGSNAGLTGSESERALDEVVLVIRPQAVMLYCTPCAWPLVSAATAHWENTHVWCRPAHVDRAPEDEELFKIHSFLVMMAECGGAGKLAVPISGAGEHAPCGDAMQIERWPLVQAFALEDVAGGGRGFLTMAFSIVDAAPALEARVLPCVDALAVERMIDRSLHELQRNWAAALDLFDAVCASPTALAAASEATLLEPLAFYFRYGAAGRTQDPRTPALPAPPFLLAGRRARLAHADAATVTPQDAPVWSGDAPAPAPVHFVLRGVDPIDRIKCARSYFVWPLAGACGCAAGASLLRRLLAAYACLVRAFGRALPHLMAAPLPLSDGAAIELFAAELGPELASAGLGDLAQALPASLHVVHTLNSWAAERPAAEPCSEAGGAAAAMRYVELAMLVDGEHALLFGESVVGDARLTEALAPALLGWSADRLTFEAAEELREQICGRALAPDSGRAVVLVDSRAGSHCGGALTGLCELGAAGLLLTHTRLGALCVPLASPELVAVRLATHAAAPGEVSSSDELTLLLLHYARLPPALGVLAPLLDSSGVAEDAAPVTLAIGIAARSNLWRLLHRAGLASWRPLWRQRDVAEAQPPGEGEGAGALPRWLASACAGRAASLQPPSVRLAPLLEASARARWAALAGSADTSAEPEGMATAAEPGAVALTVLTGVPGAQKEALAASLVAASAQAVWETVSQPVWAGLLLDVPLCRALLLEAAARGRERASLAAAEDASAGRAPRRVRLLFLTPGLCDSAHAAALVCGCRELRAAGVFLAGVTATVCLSQCPLSSTQPSVLRSPVLLGWGQQLRAGLVQCLVLQPRAEATGAWRSAELRRALAACNPAATLLTANQRGGLSHAAAIEEVLADAAFTEPRQARLRTALQPAWLASDGGAATCSYGLTHVVLRALGSSLVLDEATLRAQLSNLLGGAVRMRGARTPVRVVVLAALLRVSPSGGEAGAPVWMQLRLCDVGDEAPVLSVLEGPAPLAEHAPCLAALGSALDARCMLDFVLSCRAPCASVEAPARVDALAPGEVEMLRGRARTRPLPAGWFRDGQAGFRHVSGQRSFDHPLLEEEKEAHVARLNEAIALRNKAAAAHAARLQGEADAIRRALGLDA